MAGGEKPEVGLSAAWSKVMAEREVGYTKVSSFNMFLHHARQAWTSFVSSPLTSLLTAFTISVSLLVFAVFVLFLENIKSVVVSARKDVAVSIFLKDDAPLEKITSLQEEVKKEPYVKKSVFRTKDEALTEFRKTLGEKAVILDGLEKTNPLPASIEVTFADIEGIENQYKPFAEKFTSNPAIEHIEYSRSLIDRLSAFLKYFGWIGLISVAFMLLVTGFIITNTIKLALYSHREEIEIMSLVGATDAFIRAPYMIEGFFQGLIGSFVALFVSYIFYLLMSKYFIENPGISMILPVFSYISFRSKLLIILSGITVGAFGSYTAVRGFLKKDF
jgi:cell division transport system permease protein